MGLLVEGLVVILFLGGDGVGFVSCGFKCIED